MSLDIAKYPTLALAENPDELRSLPKESLPKLCDELRQYLLDSVSRSSGHFASGLGTVELTVALHYVYQTPFDHLVWDVGHQAYPHKILTGREGAVHHAAPSILTVLFKSCHMMRHISRFQLGYLFRC